MTGLAALIRDPAANGRCRVLTGHSSPLTGTKNERRVGFRGLRHFCLLFRGCHCVVAAALPSTAADAIPDHYDPARNPAADLKAALALAAADHKEILIDFGADWCPDCQVLTPGGKIRFATNDGSFENARTMNSDQVDAFLARWAPES